MTATLTQDEHGTWEARCPIHGRIAAGPDRHIITAAAWTHDDCEPAEGPTHSDPLPTQAQLAASYAVVAFDRDGAQVWTADGLDPAALPDVLRRLAADLTPGDGASTGTLLGVPSAPMDTDPQTTAPESLTSDDGVDTGTLADVPSEDQADNDDAEPNDDAGADLSDVPDGAVVTLSTAEEA